MRRRDRRTSKAAKGQIAPLRTDPDRPRPPRFSLRIPAHDHSARGMPRSAPAFRDGRSAWDPVAVATWTPPRLSTAQCALIGPLPLRTLRRLSAGSPRYVFAAGTPLLCVLPAPPAVCSAAAQTTKESGSAGTSLL